jgi:ribosomal protein S18 acetylase RimI-like enzyme
VQLNSSLRPAALIRQRQPEDLPGLVDVLAEAHRSAAYPVYWPADPARWLTPDQLLGAWVAEVDGVVLGHIAIATPGQETAGPWSADTGRPIGQAVEITRLFVADAAQGRSVGRRLLDEACAAARHQDRHPVLGVLDHNRAAIALYDRAGWRRLSSVDFRPHGDSIGILHCYAAP